MKTGRTETKKVEKKILSSEPVYTIGIASKKLDISVHSLRQYEREGLIIPFKTSTGRRIYSDLELEKIRCIKEMTQVEGLNFEGMRRMMALIPCHKIRGCSIKVKNSCKAFVDKTLPCWVLRESCSCQLPSCRDCPVYQSFAHCDDIKPLIYEAEK
jgi:MerR family transcriptional regulator/heat shock protein HspR